ncbi:LysM peptidoglycan-binding domain-containing protein [Bacillus tianshenii]|nr:LysM peptidoglycan-binding domain-containing protein [Bacillus tianshenii]
MSKKQEDKYPTLKGLEDKGDLYAKNSRVAAKKNKKRRGGGFLFTIAGSLLLALLVGGGIAFLLDNQGNEANAPAQETAVDEERKQMTEEAEGNVGELEADAEEASAETTSTGAASASDMKEHTVATGDTLYDLSMQYYESPKYQDFLADYNNLDSPDDLELGMVLKVPYPPKEVARQTAAVKKTEAKQEEKPKQDSAAEQPAEATEDKKEEAPADSEEGKPQEAVPSSGDVQIHTVKSGDNLYRISLQYYDTPAYQKYLAEYNNLQEADSLDLGQKVKIPPRPAEE